MPRNRRQSLTDKLAYWGNHNGVVITRQKAVECAVEFELPSASEVTQEGREQTAAVLQQIMVQVLPENCRARFIIESGPLNKDQMIRVKKAEPQDGEEQNELVEYMYQENEEVMERRRRRGALASWRYFICIRLDTNRLKFGEPVPYTPRELEDLVTKAQMMAREVAASLSAGGFRAKVVRGQEAFELIWRWFNPGYASSNAPLFKSIPTIPNISPQELRKNMKIYSDSMREQVAESNIDTTRPDALIVGDRWVQTINVVGAGMRTYAGMTENMMRRLSGHHVYYIIDLYHLKQTEERKSMNNAARGIMTTMSDTSMGTPDIGNAAVMGNVAQTLNRMMGGDEHVFEYGISILLVARDKEELDYMKEICRTELAQMTGARVIFGGVANIEQYTKNLAPMGGQENAYMYKAFSGNVVHFIPTTGPWAGSRNPIAVFRSRWGTVVGLNPKDGSDNYGTLILGSAGSGKTFLNQAWAIRVLATGAELFVVDQKRDYESFFAALKGQFVPFAPGEVINGVEVRYNVFELPEGESIPSESHKLFLMAFLTALLGGKELSGPEKSILTAAIELLYKNARTENNQGEVRYNEPTLGGFVRTMSNMNAVGTSSLKEDQEALAIIRRLSLSFQTYIGSTSLGKFLDGPSTVKINNRYVYFDISKIREDPALMRIALLITLKQLDMRMRRDPSRIKLAIIEEIGVLFQIPEAMEFVDKMYKLGRAYNLWPVGVTQEMKDFKKAGGLINNSSQFIIGRVSAEEAHTVVDVLGLNSAALPLIQSLGGVNGQYREYLVITVSDGGMRGDVIQYYPTKTEYWMFTSKPEERKRRDDLIEAIGGNTLEAIKILAGNVEK